VAKPDRTVCLTCCEANSPTLTTCFLCGAVLNHEVKGIPAYYDEMRQRMHQKLGTKHATAGEGLERTDRKSKRDSF
jgi:hypothetical protein